MRWTDDVRRANETLDWIEARQGPLKPGGYARIETDVRTVRAMAEGQDDDERISESEKHPLHHTYLQAIPVAERPTRPSTQSICLGCGWKGRVYRDAKRAMTEGDDHSLFRLRSSYKALESERDALLATSRERDLMLSRVMTAMSRDAVTINDLKARLAAAEALIDEMVAGCGLVADVYDEDGNLIPSAPHPGGHCDSFGCGDLERLRAALAGSREQAAATTTRTITMRCHCGRGVTIGPDPWCEGCVQSAATCDCVPVVIGEGA